jgi:glycosyltransferase involved in cell wall biosynthesis
MAAQICVDGSLLSNQYVGVGIHRYLVNLLRQMDRITGREDQLTFRTLVPSLAAFEGTGLTSRQGFEFVAYPAMRHQRAWMYGLINDAIWRNKNGTLFIPIPAAVYLRPRRLAVTIHDIVPLLFPDQYRAAHGVVFPLFQHRFTSSMRKADLVFTDSEHSKADMVSGFGVPPEKIVVAYLGFDSDFFRPAPADSSEAREVLRRYGIDRPYVMHVGLMEPRKNIRRLVQAHQALTGRRRDIDVQLVLCGRQAWGSEDLVQMLRQPEVRKRVILTGTVPDSDLGILYRSAACFAMPSLYEGFGLPLLEAMASGVPVMTSNRSCLPEIGGKAALYFNPECVEEISVAMERLLSDSALRRELVMEGLLRAKQFSWEACAHTTLAALKNL